MNSERVNRAAQFLPFDALKGLSEALQKKEEKLSRMQKVERSEEDAEIISETLNKIDYGSHINITYFDKGHYYEIDCEVEKKDIVYKYLQIGMQKIFFDDIYSIKLID